MHVFFVKIDEPIFYNQEEGELIFSNFGLFFHFKTIFKRSSIN